ncbi:hypothetical protein [Roseomonas sp. USHLN139]|uniref:hypothetical protein n=1 Tax=Roseomonas sp. USHLN139 TaxID=3081298 RepID=UPI003B01A11E
MSLFKVDIVPTEPDPRLVFAPNYGEDIPKLPGMWSWHSLQRRFVTLDSSSNIESVADRSGNGRTLGGVSAAARPAFVDEQINGRGVARFAGLQGLIYQGDHPTGAYTNILVVKPQASTTTGTIFGQTTSSNNNHRSYLDPNTLAFHHQAQNGVLAAGDANANAGVAAADEWHILISSFNGAANTVKAKVDAQAVAVVTKTGLTAINSLTNYYGCGNFPSGVPASGFKGDGAEMIVMSVDLLDPSQAETLAFLAGYFETAFSKTI